MGQLLRTCRYASATAAAACALVLAAGCGSSHQAHQGAAGAHSPSAAASGLAAASGPTTSPAVPPPVAVTPSTPPAASPSHPAPPGLAQCPTAALRASVGGGNGAAGSVYYPIEFTNVSADSCTMFGFPGVSFVTGISGGQLGGAAFRSNTFTASTVLLAPGQTAHASLQVIQALDYPKSMCKPVTAHWLRIYPPDQFVPLYVRFTAVTCTAVAAVRTTLGINVVKPGTSDT